MGLKNLPVKKQKLLGLGVTLTLVLALPLFIWAIVTQRFNFFNRAATGEASGEPPSPTPTSVALCLNQCGDGVCNEITCQGEGCACPETSASCSADCALPTATPTHTPTPTPYIRVVAPNGGQILATGQQYTITWQSGGIQNYLLYLVNSLGEKSLINGVSAPNTSYSWIVNSPIMTNTKLHKIKIVDAALGEVPNSTQDQSDSYFTITASTPSPTPKSTTLPTPTIVPTTKPTPIPTFPPVISSIYLPVGAVGRYYNGQVTGYEKGSTARLYMSFSGLPAGLQNGGCVNMASPRIYPWGPIPNETTVICRIIGYPRTNGIFSVNVKIYDQMARSSSKTISLFVLPQLKWPWPFPR